MHRQWLPWFPCHGTIATSPPTCRSPWCGPGFCRSFFVEQIDDCHPWWRPRVSVLVRILRPEVAVNRAKNNWIASPESMTSWRCFYKGLLKKWVISNLIEVTAKYLCKSLRQISCSLLLICLYVNIFNNLDHINKLITLTVTACARL